MGLLTRFKSWRQRRKIARTRHDIHAALDKAYKQAGVFELSAGMRVVIFSDHHKGARDGADDFQRCERTYNAALAYYDTLGYHLFELGDVEELWENSFEEVAASYAVTLQLAARFREGDRYVRFFGNHDLAWKDGGLFADRMAEFGYDAVVPLEALRVAVLTPSGDRRELFLVHGHQGTADSDRHAALSRFFVRHAWRRLQRRLNRPWNTPSVDWRLRGQHSEHMATWAESNSRVMIAGHTHLPVFFESEKQPVEQSDVPPADAPGEDEAKALDLAHAEWIKADAVRLQHQKPIALNKPCYFNTGCCSFGDGDITGIELVDGEIRLVHWECEPTTAPKRLAGMPLAAVFERIPG